MKPLYLLVKRGAEQATAVESCHSSRQLDCWAGVTIYRLLIIFRNGNRRKRRGIVVLCKMQKVNSKTSLSILRGTGVMKGMKGR
jgi:hypothetical protein